MRTPLDPAAVAPVLRREIQAVDPNLPVDRITTLSDLLSDSVSEPRFRTVVVGAFAGVALALVATGIMSELERAADVLRVKQILDCHRIRLASGDQLRQFRVDDVKPFRKRCAGGDGDSAADHQVMAPAVGVHASVAGPLRPGIDSEDSHGAFLDPRESSSSESVTRAM